MQGLDTSCPLEGFRTCRHLGAFLSQMLQLKRKWIVAIAESPGYVDLGSNSASALSQHLRSIKGSPRFSLMVALRQGTITAPFHGASVCHSDTVEWIARDCSKPGQHICHAAVCFVRATMQ